MKQNPASQSGLFTPRVLVALALCSFGVLLGMLSLAATPLSELESSPSRKPVETTRATSVPPDPANFQSTFGSNANRLPPGVPLRLGTASGASAAAAVGDINTVVGGPGTGPASNVGEHPFGVAVRGGIVYAADYTWHAIRRIDTMTATETVVAGNGTPGYTGDGGSATSAQLSGPMGAALDASGSLYIADTFNNAVRKVDASRIIPPT